MIKILFIVASNEINGSEKIALQIAGGLNPQKFDVYFAIPENGYISDKLKETAIKKIVYHNGRLNSISLKGARNLLKIIKEHKFDIIHSHASSVPGFAAKVAGVKLKIETRHGLFYSDEELENLPLKRNLFERFKKFYFDLMTTVSENDKKRLVKYFNYDENKIITIYNGLDVKFISQHKKKDIENNLDNKNFLIGNVGRLVHQKNHQLLVNVFSKVVKLHKNVKLQIIGDGELKDDLLKQINDLNLENYVEIIPYQKNIYDYINKFDFMVMTSHYEGVPLVMLEAIALGAPVVSSDVGGVNEIIKNNETGILVESFNEDEYVNKIMELIKNPAKLNEISANAFNFIQNFSVENMVKSYEELYLKYMKDN